MENKQITEIRKSLEDGSYSIYELNVKTRDLELHLEDYTLNIDFSYDWQESQEDWGRDIEVTQVKIDNVHVTDIDGNEFDSYDLEDCIDTDILKDDIYEFIKYHR